MDNKGIVVNVILEMMIQDNKRGYEHIRVNSATGDGEESISPLLLSVLSEVIEKLRQSGYALPFAESRSSLKEHCWNEQKKDCQGNEDRKL